VDGPLFKEIVLMIALVNRLDQQSLADLHARFLELLPRIELHGRIFFRHLGCHDKKADAIQEMRALAWKWFLRLAQRGKDPADFLSTFNGFLSRAVIDGRKVTGMENAKDAMSPHTQRRHGFRVESLSVPSRTTRKYLYSAIHGQQEHDAFEERLQDNTVTPVPDQAAFRIDWPAWMKTRTERDRQIIDDLMAGERTLDVSRKYGLSPARISQLRGEYQEDWDRFTSESVEMDLGRAAA
jgi:hypothetical protein